MPSSPSTNRNRQINGVQFVAIIVAIALIGSLIGGLTAGLLVPAVGAAGATVRALPETFRELPSDLDVIEPSEGSQLLDSEGRVLTNFYTDRRIVVTSEQIPQIMRKAIVAIEDRRFYTHHGVDPEGILRAAVNNLTSGATKGGGSTITQQYVKNILMEQGIQAGDQSLIDAAQEVSAERKLREARYALALESQLTKDEILTGYLNLATFGTNIYGVEAASRAYFSKAAADLTVGEAALLAGTVQSPVAYDPLVHPDAAQARRDDVLDWMLVEDYITQEEYDEAVAIAVTDMLNPESTKEGCAGAGSAGYYCRWAQQEFLSDPTFGETRAARETLLNTGGLTLRTHLSSEKQRAAQQAVTDLVPEYDSSQIDTAIVSSVPDTGALVAMAQNTTFGIATEGSPRKTEVSYTADLAHGGGEGYQPGSTFKIFTLVEWLATGHGAYDIAGSGNRDYPTYSFTCHGERLWTEDYTANDLPGKDGPMEVLRALNVSANQVFINMASKMDLCDIMDRAADLGVTQTDGEPIPPIVPNVLGTHPVPPVEMLTAFATIANDGKLCKLQALAEVEDRDGNILKTYTPECSPVLEATVAQKTATILQMSASKYVYQIGRPFAAKSGTTDNNSNVWLVGFVPQLATAAWVGTASQSSRPLNEIVINGQYYEAIYGQTFAGKMWAQYMEQALANTPVENIPTVFIGNKPQPVYTAPTTPGYTQPPATQAPATEGGEG
mgnify:FL=1